MKFDVSIPAVPPRFGEERAPSTDLGDRVFAAVEDAPARRMPLARRLAIASGLLPLVSVLPLLVRRLVSGRALLRVDLGELPREQLLIEVALVVGVTLGVTLLALRPGRTGLGSGVVTLLGASLAVVPSYLVAEVLWPLRASAPGALETAAHLHPWGAPCGILAAASGTMALGALMWALRGAVPAAVRARGATLGAASGAWAALALFLHCPGCATQHVLASHILPILAFTVVGALAAPRLLRP